MFITTDLLQPMDLSVNKPANLRQKFQHWYSEKLMEQLEEVDDINNEPSKPKYASNERARGKMASSNGRVHFREPQHRQ